VTKKIEYVSKYFAFFCKQFFVQHNIQNIVIK